MICVLVEKVKRMLVRQAARCEHESIGTPSVCTVSKVQNEIMSWLPQACLQVPHWATFAIGMHVMLGLDREHGMQLECALVHIFVNIVRITQ
jgi:hypothetical protein